MYAGVVLKTGIQAIDDSSCPFIAGSDEVGLGAWSGPLVVAAVAVPREWAPPIGLTDSKMMSEKALQSVYGAFIERAPKEGLYYEVHWAFTDEIDRDGVGPVLRRLHHHAMSLALKAAREMGSGHEPLGIVDGNVSIEGCFALPKADRLVPAVSMASVLAKVSRDRWMAQAESEYPGYAFSEHVGYGTAKHRAALAKLGPCPIHRKSYRPIAELLKGTVNDETLTPIFPLSVEEMIARLVGVPDAIQDARTDTRGSMGITSTVPPKGAEGESDLPRYGVVRSYVC